jgi:anti-sigma regulatory factor (Ser/Thr protein kinase)
VSPRLLLDPEPASVRRARSWVADRLHVLGRDDLTDAAELGVSELVTNAILHASPPITVRVRGTRAHPRVEVHDNSRRPPTLDAGMAEEDHLLKTWGRGLGIVALYSQTWGAEVSPDGKVVWFEPSLEPDLEGGLDGDVFDLDEVLEERLAGLTQPVRQITVRLVGMPAQVFAEFRDWYSEIRRELRILALSHSEEYPLASEVAEIALLVEQDRRLARGIERLDRAIAGGADRIDLEYQVPATAPETMRRMSELLDLVDMFCRDHRLLTAGASAQLRELWHWYCGEFARQAEGAEPLPWQGAYQVERDE